MESPLARPLLALLRACAEEGTTRTKPLAERLHLSPRTIDTYFDRINERLGTKDRGISLCVALRLGWVEADALNVPAECDDSNCTDGACLSVHFTGHNSPIAI